MTKLFFSINPKSILLGHDLFAFADFANQAAQHYDFDIYFSCPTVYLSQLAHQCTNMIISAQTMDISLSKEKMGSVNIDFLQDAGAKAVVLNHDSNPMTYADLSKAVEQCRERRIQSLVCGGDREEIRQIAFLKPDMIICEQNTLIGTGIVSDMEYINDTNRFIKTICPDTRISQSGGIKSKMDIIRAIWHGADGTGSTSGIFGSTDPRKTLIEFLDATKEAEKDGGEDDAHETVIF